MKFTWGTGIFIFLILFLLAAAAFIVFAMSKDVNLVHEEYYQKGVDYTAQMNREKRSQKYENSIYLKDENEQITLFFPDEFADELESGTILFFRPSDRKLDVEFTMTSKSNQQTVSKEKLRKGRYIVQLAWKIKGEEFYIEKTIFVK